MKTQNVELRNDELAKLEGGVSALTLVVVPILLGGGLTAAGYVAKDIYDNWDSFKKAVADGWKAV